MSLLYQSGSLTCLTGACDAMDEGCLRKALRRNLYNFSKQLNSQLLTLVLCLELTECAEQVGEIMRLPAEGEKMGLRNSAISNHAESNMFADMSVYSAHYVSCEATFSARI